MLIKIEGHEIVDAKISKVSLVKRAAIRAPFKIQKSAGAPPDNTPPPEAGNPKVIPHIQPDNGETALGYRIDDRYPLGRPSNPLNLRKTYTLDSMILDAHRRKHHGW